MESFLMYIIICVASTGTGGCNDFGPRVNWYYKDKQSCEVMVDKLLNAYIKEIEKKGKLVADGKAFCLRYRESKKI